MIATLTNDEILFGYSQFRTNPKNPEIQFIEINSNSVEVRWSQVPDVQVYLIAITTGSDDYKVEKEVSASTDTFRFENLVKRL